MQSPPTPSPPSPISPTRTRLVPTLHPNPQPLTMPCRFPACALLIFEFLCNLLHSVVTFLPLSFAEAAAALSSADAGAAAPCATSARLIDNILNAKFTSIHALSSFAKNPQANHAIRALICVTDMITTLPLTECPALPPRVLCC